ncbi:ectomycorrhizas-regulated small secreted protein [Ephemerocybe angulata]|uniref:Ectomycorrhizas-regulated small secreted protein n=1 Tax=Ephemerocybe angulata TaxID=980116 RepID=A0A8H6I0D3_9AGAR|nr:ectomycorrhizas-regulated small secreted protein [Tulosesus angulatus]
MRLSLIALVPLTALFSVVHAHSDYTYEAREHIDELATRQHLADLSTRDLLDELEDRLQHRGDRYYCVESNKHFYSKKEANDWCKDFPNHMWTKNGVNARCPF